MKLDLFLGVILVAGCVLRVSDTDWRTLTFDEITSVIGGLCFSNDVEKFCVQQEAPACADKFCECKVTYVYELDEYGQPVWTGWSGWSSGNCNQYDLQQYIDYEIQSRCPAGTKGLMNPQPTYSTCDDDEEGPFNTVQLDGFHYCYQTRSCAFGGCTFKTDGHAYCADADGTPSNDEETRVQLQDCFNSAVNPPCLGE